MPKKKLVQKKILSNSSVNTVRKRLKETDLDRYNTVARNRGEKGCEYMYSDWHEWANEKLSERDERYCIILKSQKASIIKQIKDWSEWLIIGKNGDYKTEQIYIARCSYLFNFDLNWVAWLGDADKWSESDEKKRIEILANDRSVALVRGFFEHYRLSDPSDDQLSEKEVRLLLRINRKIQELSSMYGWGAHYKKLADKEKKKNLLLEILCSKSCSASLIKHIPQRDWEGFLKNVTSEEKVMLTKEGEGRVRRLYTVYKSKSFRSLMEKILTDNSEKTSCSVVKKVVRGKKRKSSSQAATKAPSENVPAVRKKQRTPAASRGGALFSWRPDARRTAPVPRTPPGSPEATKAPTASTDRANLRGGALSPWRPPNREAMPAPGSTGTLASRTLFSEGSSSSDRKQSIAEQVARLYM